MNSFQTLYIKFRHYYKQLNRIEKFFLNIFIIDMICYSFLLSFFLIATGKFAVDHLFLPLLIFPIISGIITVRNYNICKLSIHLKLTVSFYSFNNEPYFMGSYFLTFTYFQQLWAYYSFIQNIIVVMMENENVI